ncbi:hypothetical protein F2P81_006207 [Scophthalmus maximus]|uniref:Acyl-coenzyme A thioesterase 4-like n=1 Tax=Scophthalmus maximus TaxID=52904 RepID=A0A6A4T5W2_SCOMX|nr:hypothetical protein F2P81_006207 [Scophthalmus maximus]
MGLLWSLRPVPGSKTGLRMRKMNVQTPMEVTLSVYQGHMTEGFVDQVPLASVLVERWYIAPGIRRIPVTEGGLTATLFLPPVSEDLSLGGTYSGVEPMGLLWSLRPVPGSKPGLRLRKMNVQTPMEVTVSVYRGHKTDSFVDQVPLAIALVERWYMAPGIRRIPITEGGLTAPLFLPLGPGPFPGVLDLWGGGGNLVEYRSALFACHGLASLALDYLTPKITKETGKMVDNEYIETAYRVLQQHPQVLGSSIAMLGLSFGTSVTLKMAVYSEVIKVGRLQCPLLLVVGEDDQNWPAYESAMDMKEMMERAGNSHLLTVLSYPNAGHLIEPPYTPHARASNFIPINTRQKTDIFRNNRFERKYKTKYWSHDCRSQTAYRVLQQHPQVLGSRIAMLGLSLGSSVTLKVAVYSEIIKGGATIKKESKTHVNKENQVIIRDMLLPIPTDPSFKVDCYGASNSCVKWLLIILMNVTLSVSITVYSRSSACISTSISLVYLSAIKLSPSPMSTFPLNFSSSRRTSLRQNPKASWRIYQLTDDKPEENSFEVCSVAACTGSRAAPRASQRSDPLKTKQQQQKTRVRHFGLLKPTDPGVS